MYLMSCLVRFGGYTNFRLMGGLYYVSSNGGGGGGNNAHREDCLKRELHYLSYNRG